MDYARYRIVPIAEIRHYLTTPHQKLKHPKVKVRTVINPATR